jgi:Ca2+-binding EF-hand superfamily protein
MKHNPGCPFGAKCRHGPNCAHPKENNQNQNMNNNNSNNNSQNMNNNNQNMNNSHYNNCPFGHNQNNYNPKNSNNSNINNNSNNSNNNNNYQPNNIQNRPPNNKKITYTYSDPNSPYNNMNNNNINDENDQNNPNYENDSNNGPNDNQNYNNNSNDNQNYNNDSDNDDPNNNGPYNNGPYNNNNNIPFQNQNNQNPNENNPNNQNQNQNQNNPNPNKSCPLSPISSAFPPNSPFFNANEPGENSNWIFCPKCNVYHRCPHPGCDHNPNKRTTTHKCLHEDNLNKSLPNINNINNPNQPNFPNNQSGMQNPTSSSRGGQMNTSRRNKPPRKRDVFSSCPYQEELGQFVDFLGYLMEVESQIEDLKIELARRDDFNFEDIFRIFEVDGKGYIEPEDLKQGLKLLGLDPSDFDIRLLIKRFDLNKQGLLSYTDFFDMVVSFEKKMRNSVQIRPPNSCCPCKSPDVFECDTLIAIKNLFKYIIECEKNINQMRMNFDSLRSKYSDVVQFLDVSRRGVINRSDLKLYLTQFNKFTTSKECDLLFIRLDKTRSGEVGIDEIENELMFLR